VAYLVEDSSAGLKDRTSYGLLVTRIVSLGVLAIVFARTAWIGDDALITLRHSLNWVHGWGPGFNATESVLGATHPLWFLLWTLVGGLTDEWIAANFAMSLVFSVLAAALILWSSRSTFTVIAAAGMLGLSSAFVDYTSSGLENPLALVFTGLLVLLSRSNPTASTGRSILVGVTAAALVLTRPDLFLVAAAPLLGLAWTGRTKLSKVLTGVGAFLAPLAAWFAFSWSAYASLVPNTLAAKSNLEIPRSDLVEQGIRYLTVSFEQDWASLAIFIISASSALALGRRIDRLWILGIGLYLAYVVWIGGDFMVGRFLAVPIYTAVLLAAVTFDPKRLTSQLQWRWPLVPTVVLVLLGLVVVMLGPRPTSLTRDPGQRWPGSFGIADERGVYSEFGRTLHKFLGDRNSAKPFSFVQVSEADPWGRITDYDQAAKAWPASSGEMLIQPDQVGIVCWLGATALVTGPRAHWIDTCALTDRFLADLPSGGSDWRVGHFKREVPPGYPLAVLANDPGQVEDPGERERLRKLWAMIK